MRTLRNQFALFALLGFMAGGILFLFIDKGDVVLWINARHSPTFGILMKYWTILGDGIMILVLFIAMLFYRYYYAIAAILLSILVLLFSQGLKRTVFEGWERPTAYFEEDREWNTVEGVEISRLNTFPSGHTTAGFAIMFFLSIVINKRWFYVLGFFLAAGVGLSRIYLLQHFFADVYFGAFLGMLAAIISLFLSTWILGKKAERLRERSLISTFKG